MGRRWVILVLLAAVLAASCGGDDDSSSGTTTSTTAAAEDGEPIRLVTFNAGLARGFVDLAEQRVEPVAEAVAGVDADVVALQEVWEPGDVEQVRSACAEAGFDAITFLDPAPETSGDAACPAGDLDGLETCVRTSCAGVPTEGLADCVLSSCGAEYGALAPVCQSCLAANVGKPLEEVLATCTGGAASYAYGGSFGIGLASRLSVLESDHLVLDSSLNRRAILYSKLDAGALGDLHVFATHLSAVFDDIPYPGEGSWEEEQADQIRRLLQLVDETVPDGEPVVVLGDLNTGPAVAGVPGEVPDNYQLLVDAGFAAPYVDGPDAACTYCEENPLVGGADDDDSALIDHVLVRDLDASVTAERVFEEEITVAADGGQVATRLSDHYGVGVTITPTTGG